MPYAHLPMSHVLNLCSLRWHDPDQVNGSQEYLPLSLSIQTPQLSVQK